MFGLLGSDEQWQFSIVHYFLSLEKQLIGPPYKASSSVFLYINHLFLRRWWVDS